MKGRISLALITLSGWSFGGPWQTSVANDEIFDVDELAVAGRVVSVEMADFDGDARNDLMLVTFQGIPPAEIRLIRIYLQSPAGAFGAAPSHEVAIPRSSAIYDIADVKSSPGQELLLLRPDRVTILSLAKKDGDRWDLPIDGPSTVAAADDERGFDPFPLVYGEFGPKPWIVVPQIGAVSALSLGGDRVAYLETGGRANYFVARSKSLVSAESDIQLFLDVPKLSVGDVDGDGLADIVTATRHEIRIFRRETGGGFPRLPDETVRLGMIGERDHIRGSGSVVATARDIDGDGRLDLLISRVEGSFVDTTTTTSIYRNRSGRWDLGSPDEQYVSEGRWSSDLLLDIDSDGTQELVRIQLKFSLLEIVELLLTREIDTQISIHRLGADGRFGDEPWSEKKVSTGISFETFRPKGFMPKAEIDLNADGLMDFVTSGDGKSLDVYLGGRDGPFARRSARQDLPTAGVIRFGDLDGDGLPDFVLYNPQDVDAPVRIGRNRGALPDPDRRRQ